MMDLLRRAEQLLRRNETFGDEQSDLADEIAQYLADRRSPMQIPPEKQKLFHDFLDAQAEHERALEEQRKANERVESTWRQKVEAEAALLEGVGIAQDDR